MRQTADKYICILYIRFYLIQLKCFFSSLFHWQKLSHSPWPQEKERYSKYYLLHMSQEVLQMHDFQLLNPYCRVKGLSALDFKAFPSITFAFPTALKRHSAVFSSNLVKIFSALSFTQVFIQRSPRGRPRHTMLWKRKE